MNTNMLLILSIPLLLSSCARKQSEEDYIKNIRIGGIFKTEMVCVVELP